MEGNSIVIRPFAESPGRHSQRRFPEKCIGEFRFAGEFNEVSSDVEFSGEAGPALTGVTVNYARIALASLGAMAAYFVYGFAMFAAWPSMKTEFMKYPNVYRPKDELMKVMPYGMIAIFFAIVVVAVLYAKIYTAAGGIVPGLCLGALIGLFSVCTFAIHNYINLNIGLTLTIYQSVAYFIQWVIVGATIGLIYKPS